MARGAWKKDIWIKGGAVGSLLALALSVITGRRLPARLASGLAGAFLERWDEIRLAKRVKGLLSEADRRGEAPLRPETEDALARLWGRH